MPRCGVCGELYGQLVVKHAYECEDYHKAEAQPYSPEIDDLIKMDEEGRANASL